MAIHQKSVYIELTSISARDLKNVNWRDGYLRPYVVVWVDPHSKICTKVDQGGDANPCWNENLTIPLTKPIENAELQFHIVHDKPLNMTKPLVGTALISLKEVLDEVGFDEILRLTLEVKRPSGRSHGNLEVSVRLKEKMWADMQYPPPGGYSQPYETGNYAPPQIGYPSQEYPYGYPSRPPSGYTPSAPPYGDYYTPPWSYAAYGDGDSYPRSRSCDAYGGNIYNNQDCYGYGGSYGVGNGLTVGAVAGVIGGLALAEGADNIHVFFC